MKLKNIIKITKKETGQAMVEFALVLPILLLLIGGIIDFGWIFFNQISANNASREAARYVAIHYTIEPINGDNTTAVNKAKEKIEENILNSFIMDSDSVTVSHYTEPEEYIRVDLKGDIIVLTPILQSILTDRYEINVHTTMRIEK